MLIVLFISHFEIAVSLPLASVVSNENSVVIQIIHCSPVNNAACLKFWGVFFLSLHLSSLIMICLGVDFFECVQFAVC